MIKNLFALTYTKENTEDEAADLMGLVIRSVPQHLDAMEEYIDLTWSNEWSKFNLAY